MKLHTVSSIMRQRIKCLFGYHGENLKILLCNGTGNLGIHYCSTCKRYEFCEWMGKPYGVLRSWRLYRTKKFKKWAERRKVYMRDVFPWINYE